MSHNQPPPAEPPHMEPPAGKAGVKPGWARKRIAIPAALLIFFVGVGVGSSDSNGQEKAGTTGKAEPRPTVTVTRTAEAEPAKADDAEPAGDDKPAADDEKATVPDFVGMGLQSAQDKAQELGFHILTSHDALGRDRMQAFDRNWKVCSQNVKSGTSASTGTELDFGAVKLEEGCPAKDEKPPSAAGGKMPDFTGKSVKAARGALDSGTSLTVEDASPEGRWVLVESNWQVCTQKPAAGEALKGQPVTLTAVKFGESCP
ncbi:MULTISPECIES: PASTA domain-containing protein [unclassified Streptomyces]|uniref:PASTA domain-containing protein n=1 Tax=unclassified Streptomyces TaxID=2593676 RepID=UPI00093C933C|nr:PASTA domain-containing protein [Streptomyces sp. TSRI0107]